MIKTEAGEKMKKENPNKELPEKADINKDGEFQEWEKARHEAIQAAQAEDDTPEMNMGGLMRDGMGIIVGIETESGNKIPAGSLPEEVADDIPAMLSEGEYVVPADVVRWHGVKTFEELRCEAKMGMGLMAEDGRIAEVDEDTRQPIEETDKPKMEYPKVKVVEANEGAFVTPQAPFYRYESRLNPATNRFEFVAVDPTTGEQVTPETFDQARSTRYTPQTVLGLDSQEEPECPDGFEYDAEVGACMPVEAPVRPRSVVATDGGDDAGIGTPDYVPYSEQLTTRMAESLGPLSAEDLADMPGATLSDKAIARMTDNRQPSLLQGLAALAGGVGGVVGLGAKNIYDSVGAKRAALTRENELISAVEGLPPITGRENYTMLGLEPTGVNTGVNAYNWTFNPDTASFNPTAATTAITAVQERESGGSWVTDYDNVGASGTQYTREEVFENEDAFEDVIRGIENDLATYSTVTGSGKVSDRGDSGYSPTESAVARDYGTTAGSEQTSMLAEQEADFRDEDTGDTSSDGGGCCFILLEARYGDGTMDNVFRKYRNDVTTDRNKRGYYKLAEVFVPLMRKSQLFKWVVTKTMADPLVSYGKYYYGENKHGVIFAPVKSFWMKIFDVLGGDTKFIRENGEVV
jgi:hypothetical protein